MKAKDLKGLLPEKRIVPLRGTHKQATSRAFNKAIDTIGEKELYVATCPACGGYQEIPKPERMIKCGHCENGFIITVKP